MYFDCTQLIYYCNASTTLYTLTTLLPDITTARVTDLLRFVLNSVTTTTDLLRVLLLQHYCLMLLLLASLIYYRVSSHNITI